MTLVRILVTLFVAAILAATIAGWVWTGQHQPPAGAIASRVVLGISALAGLVALIVVWRPNPWGANTPTR
jgi:hypothetical protein